LSLLYRALSDISYFLIVFFIFLTYFCISYYIVGANFDDGDNYELEGEYDDQHNDFKKIYSAAVMALQVFRTSISDLQPPQYDYWGARIEMGDTHWAQFMIIFIWLLWVGQIVLIVICMLNFLIAIVSDSYNFVMESEKLSQILRR
jgi:hypothetical protein